MTIAFETAAGSVAGRSHVIAGKNNHDAWHVYNNYLEKYGPHVLIALVADGCGSGAHSEVGAKLGVELLTDAIFAGYTDSDQPFLRAGYPGKNEIDLALHCVRGDVLKTLDDVVKKMAGSLAKVVNDFFLFTIVGTIVTPRVSIFFSLGDGTMIINGEKISLGPFPGNAPPYLAYGSQFVRTSLKEENPDALNFVVNRILPTEELDHFLIGTDGLDYLAAAAEKNMPGKSEKIGPLSQFWEEDRFFTNPDMVRRRLTLINAESVKLDRQNLCLKKEAGPLLDDTTLIAGRRIPMKGDA